MITLPMRRDPAPLAVRSVVLRTRPVGGADPGAHAAAEAGIPDDTLAEALAKASTPEDQALAKQQAQFDQLAALRAEQQREANVIRDMMMTQLKQDEEVLKKWIEMI